MKICKYLWCSLSTALQVTRESCAVVRDLVLDVVDEATGAREIQQALTQENVRLTQELCAARAHVTQLTQDNAGLRVAANRYRESASQNHELVSRYEGYDRCDDLARVLYRENAPTIFGVLDSTACN